MPQETERRTLHLLRHAKSSRDDPALADHERPLAPRGVRACEALRGHLAEAGIEPGLVLCSSAVRAVQTLEGVRDGLPDATAVEIEDRLYAAGADDLLRRLHEVPAATSSVMLVGHNPSVEELAGELIGGGDAEAGARLAEKYPTGGLATLTFDGAWNGLAANGAALEAFVVPREL